jgi:hypothetical protein
MGRQRVVVDLLASKQLGQDVAHPLAYLEDADRLLLGGELLAGHQPRSGTKVVLAVDLAVPGSWPSSFASISS